MNVLFCGSRDITNNSNIVNQILTYEVSTLRKRFGDNITIIHGGAIGIDMEINTRLRGIYPIIVYKPDYINYSKIAPLIRDKKMVDVSDVIIAIWNGSSRGTRYTVDYAKSKQKPVILYTLKNNSYKVEQTGIDKLFDLQTKLGLI